MWVFGSGRGWISLDVTVDGRHVRGSPAQLQVAAGGATSHHCFATGSGVDPSGGIFSNETSRFTIVACDATGAPRSEGGDGFRVSITPRHAGTGSMVCHDQGDGTYSVSWTPVVSGRYLVAVTLGRVHIRGSPYRISVGQRRGPPPFAMSMRPPAGRTAAVRYTERGLRSAYERAAVAAACATDADAAVEHAVLLAQVEARGQCPLGWGSGRRAAPSHRQVACASGAASPVRGALSPAAGRAHGAVSLLPSPTALSGPVRSLAPSRNLRQAWLETDAAEDEAAAAGEAAAGEVAGGPFALGPLDHLLSRFRRVLQDEDEEDGGGERTSPQRHHCDDHPTV